MFLTIVAIPFSASTSVLSPDFLSPQSPGGGIPIERKPLSLSFHLACSVPRFEAKRTAFEVTIVVRIESFAGKNSLNSSLC